jgi:hypothetical protein
MPNGSEPVNPGVPLLPQNPPPAPAPAPAPQPQRYGPNGQYASIDEWSHATRASEQESSRLARENEQMRSRMAELESAVQANLAGRTGRSTPEDELETLGIPLNSLREVVRASIQQEIKPLYDGMQAEQQVFNSIPEYGDIRGDVHRFIASDAGLLERFNQLQRGNAQGAYEWAVGMWRLKHGKEPSRSADPATAGLPGGQAPPAPSAEPEGPSNERLNAATDHFIAYGDPSAAVHERLKGYPGLKEHLQKG